MLLHFQVIPEKLEQIRNILNVQVSNEAALSGMKSSSGGFVIGHTYLIAAGYQGKAGPNDNVYQGTWLRTAVISGATVLREYSLCNVIEGASWTALGRAKVFIVKATSTSIVVDRCTSLYWIEL